VVGTLNQDTTGNAATATALATARTIGGTSFDGTANIAVALSATATALASARTIHGVSFDGTANIDLTEVVQDTVGAMFGSNTETGITVTYEDGDGTIDLVVGTLNQDTTGLAGTATALATARTIGGTSFDGTANIAVALAATATALASARTIHGVSFDGTANIDLTEVVQDTVGAMFSSNTETGITVSYEDGDGTIDLVVGTLNQDTTGLAGTATALATARTIHGVSFDGTANIDLSEVISDTVGAMFSSNTETYITATYQDADNTIDLVIGTLNQDTTGLAGTATALATARTIGGTSFDGTANIAVALAATTTALASARTIHGVSFDGTANIDLTEVVQDTVGAMFSSNTETGVTVSYEDSDGTIDLVVGTLNQDTTGLAATATALATARTIGGTSFDGTANIAVALSATATALATGRTIGMTGDVVWTSPSFTGSGNVTAAATIQSGAVETAMIAADAITAAKIGDNVINSEHYAADSIDEEHIANDAVGSAELKTLSTLLIKNSAGSTLKTVHGAGA
jgi:hypothetical protein